ncbi:putative ubiquinol-cytochrome C reductase complex 14kD subunit [Thozetella sp. PMI_491]|nr:putative ubiquinol-cytochrome C reductase complex 14kD subunit [Thozetella sp. PMI_491]
MASLAPFILKRPWLQKMVAPLASWYGQASGYRQLGLRFDDLLEEERESVQVALKRLGEKERYDRIYRIRRAVQLDITKKVLPRDQWTKPEDDKPYLMPLVEQVEAEWKERNDLDTLTPLKSH